MHNACPLRRSVAAGSPIEDFDAGLSPVRKQELTKPKPLIITSFITEISFSQNHPRSKIEAALPHDEERGPDHYPRPPDTP